MRIALVTDTCAPAVNGVATVVHRMLEAIRSGGHSAVLVAPRFPHHRDLRGDELRLPSIACPVYPDVRLASPLAPGAHRFLDRFAPDVVHSITEGPLGWLGRRHALRRGLGLVTSFHTDFPRYCRDCRVPWLEPAVWSWLVRFHRPATVVHTPGEATREVLQARGLTQAVVWGRSVDTELFTPERRTPVVRELLGFPHDATVILHVGRLAREKNLGVLIESWREVRERWRHPIVFVIAGDGPLANHVRREAPWARHLGFLARERLADLYAAADLCVLPSATETCGLVALEAMASGTAVVAADAGGFRESIQDGRNGVLVVPDDARRFAAATLRLLFDPEARRALGQQGRAAALARSGRAEHTALLAHYAAAATRLPVAGILCPEARAS